jgi:hypothetical protein
MGVLVAVQPAAERSAEWMPDYQHANGRGIDFPMARCADNQGMSTCIRFLLGDPACKSALTLVDREARSWP